MKRKAFRIAKDRVYTDAAGILWECCGTRGQKALMRKAGETTSPVPIALDFLESRLKPARGIKDEKI